MEKTMQNAPRERRNAARAMSNAHRMAAETVKQYPGTDARAAWERMDGPAQLDALQRMTRTLKRRDGAIMGKDGKPLPPVLEWAINDGDLEAVANEAWIRAAQRIQRPGELPPLGMILFLAVYRAAEYIARQERRSARAIRYEEQTGPDGEQTETAYIIDHAAPTADPIAPSPEAAAVLRDLLERAARTPQERATLRARAYGYTIPEIASASGVALATVQRRLQRIRDAYAAAQQ